ncbi:hypothetical protein Tco_0277384 [Tanacetum coccineum]
MKEILHQRMFESGSHQTHLEHAKLYEALDRSMARDNMMNFLQKRPSLERDVVTIKILLNLLLKSLIRQAFPSVQPIDDAPTPADEHISDSEDTDTTRLPKIKTPATWLRPLPEEDRPKTPKPDSFVPPNDLPEPKNNWDNALAKTYKDPEENKSSVQGSQSVSPEQHFLAILDGRLSPAAYRSGDKERKTALSISKLKAAHYPNFGLEELEFYITRHGAPSDRRTVRSYMRILSVISLKTYERYGYTYLREIVIRRADYNEYKISEANFKNLHLNDFEDLYLLHLQGKLNHLTRSDKVHLYNAINLWIRSIVIRQCVGDLQLGIESYQIKLNLTQPRWDASDFLFKEDYTIVSKPRAAILVQSGHGEYALIRGCQRRSEEFIELIERRLKIRRIFWNLESFVGG